MPIASVIGVGFFGTKLAQELKKLHWTVRGSSTSPDIAQKKVPYLDTAIYYSSLDPHSQKNLISLLDGVDLLIIAAAPKNETLYKETYLGIIEDIQKISSQITNPPKQLIYISSTAVYGDQNGISVAEDETNRSRLDPQSAILFDGEEKIQKLDFIPNRTILRFGELTGDTSESPRNLVYRIHKLSGKTAPTDGKAITNLTHVEDGVRAVIFAYDNNLNGIYNIVSDLHLPRKMLYEYILKRDNLPQPLWAPSEETAERHTQSKTALNEKIKKSGFVFQYPIYPLTVA